MRAKLSRLLFLKEARMNIKISFKHLEHTPALDQRIREKSQHFNKYFDGKFDLQWICWVDDKGEHWAELKLYGPKFQFFASACEDTIYKSLDQVVNKIEKQIDKKKTKMRNKVHGANYDSPKYRQMRELEKDEEKVYMEEYERKAV